MLKLGPLDNVIKLSVISKQLELDRSWYLPEFHSNEYVKSQVPNELTLMRGDSLVLPIILRQGEKELKRTWFRIQRLYQDDVIEDWFDRVVLERDE